MTFGGGPFSYLPFSSSKDFPAQATGGVAAGGAAVVTLTAGSGVTKLKVRVRVVAALASVVRVGRRPA
jgi:hypothetical protein